MITAADKKREEGDKRGGGAAVVLVRWKQAAKKGESMRVFEGGEGSVLLGKTRGGPISSREDPVEKKGIMVGS